MAGKRMTSTEIWLRLINIGSLYGDAMLEIAQRLLRQATVDAEAVNAAGLSPKHAVKFFSFSESELERSLEWLEHTDNHLLTADDPRFPPLLRSIPDFPGALFVRGRVDVLNSMQLAVVGSRAPSWYGERWGKCSVNSCPNVALRSPVAWLAASTVWHIMRRCQQKGEVSPCLAMVFLVSIRVVITFWLSNLSLLKGR